VLRRRGQGGTKCEDGRGGPSRARGGEAATSGSGDDDHGPGLVASWETWEPAWREAVEFLCGAEGGRAAAALCRQLGLGASDADDLIQDCCVGLRRTFVGRAERGKPQVPAGEDLQRYARRALRSTAYDWLRRQQRRRDRPVRIAGISDDAGALDPEAELDRLAAGREPPAVLGGGADATTLRRSVLAAAVGSPARGHCPAPVVAGLALHVLARLVDGQAPASFLELGLQGGTTPLDRAIWEGLALVDPDRFGAHSAPSASPALRQRKRRCQQCTIELLVRLETGSP
jgi:hypothetical protein